MSIRHIVSTILVSVALFAAQGASAQNVPFIKKNIEVTDWYVHAVSGQSIKHCFERAKSPMDNVRVTFQQ